MITIDNLRKIQRSTALKTRDFVDTALEFAAELGITIPNLPAKNRTLPKLLAHFTQYASEADLLRTLPDSLGLHGRRRLGLHGRRLMRLYEDATSDRLAG